MKVSPTRIMRPSLFCGCALVIALLAASASGQSIIVEQPPGVTVLDCKWEKTHYHPPLDSAYPTPPAVGEHVEGVPNASRAPVKFSDAYRYSIHVRNEGPKVIKSMAWDYVFSDPDGKQELGRRL